MDTNSEQCKFILTVFEEIVTYFFRFVNSLETNCENFDWRRICKFVRKKIKNPRCNSADILKIWNDIKRKVIEESPYLPSISKHIPPWKYFDLLANHLLADVSSKGEKDISNQLMRIYFNQRFAHQRIVKQKHEEDYLIVSEIQKYTTQVKDTARLKSGIDVTTVWSNIGAGFERNFGYRPSKESLQLKFRKLLVETMSKLETHTGAESASEHDSPILLNRVEKMLIDIIPEIKRNCEKSNLPLCDNNFVSKAFGDSVSTLEVSAFIDLTDLCKFPPHVDQKAKEEMNVFEDAHSSITQNVNRVTDIMSGDIETLNTNVKLADKSVDCSAENNSVCHELSEDLAGKKDVTKPKIYFLNVSSDTNDKNLNLLDSVNENSFGAFSSGAVQTNHDSENLITKEETVLSSNKQSVIDNKIPFDISLHSNEMKDMAKENISFSHVSHKEIKYSPGDVICQRLPDNIDGKKEILNFEMTCFKALKSKRNAMDSNKYTTVAIIDIADDAEDCVENNNNFKDSLGTDNDDMQNMIATGHTSSVISFDEKICNVNGKRRDSEMDISLDKPLDGRRNAHEFQTDTVIGLDYDEDVNFVENKNISEDLHNCNTGLKRDSIAAISSVTIEVIDDKDDCVARISNHSNDHVKDKKETDSPIVIDDDVAFCHDSDCSIVTMTCNAKSETSPKKKTVRRRNTAISGTYKIVAVIDVCDNAEVIDDSVENKKKSDEDSKVEISTNTDNNHVRPGVDSALTSNNKVYTIDISEDSNDGTNTKTILSSGSSILTFNVSDDDSNGAIQFDSDTGIKNVSLNKSTNPSSSDKVNDGSKSPMALSQTKRCEVTDKLSDSNSSLEMCTATNGMFVSSSGNISEVTTGPFSIICKNKQTTSKADSECASQFIDNAAHGTDNIGPTDSVVMKSKIDTSQELHSVESRLPEDSCENTFVRISEFNITTSESAVLDKTSKREAVSNVLKTNVIVNLETTNHLKELPEKTMIPLPIDSLIANELIEGTDQISNDSFHVADSTSTNGASNSEVSNINEFNSNRVINKIEIPLDSILQSKKNSSTEGIVSSTSSSCNEVISGESNETSEPSTSALTSDTKNANTHLSKAISTASKDTIVKQPIKSTIGFDKTSKVSDWMSPVMAVRSNSPSDTIALDKTVDASKSCDKEVADETDRAVTANEFVEVPEVLNNLNHSQICDSSKDFSTDLTESITVCAVSKESDDSDHHMTVKKLNTACDGRNLFKMANIQYDKITEDTSPLNKIEDDSPLNDDINKILNDFITSSDTTTVTSSIPVYNQSTTGNVVSHKTADAITVKNEEKESVVNDHTVKTPCQATEANCKIKECIIINDVSKLPLNDDKTLVNNGTVPNTCIETSSAIIVNVASENIKATFIKKEPDLSMAKERDNDISSLEQNHIIKALKETAVSVNLPATLAGLSNTSAKCETVCERLDNSTTISQSQVVCGKKSIIKNDDSLNNDTPPTAIVEFAKGSCSIQEEIVTLDADALRERQINHLTVGMDPFDCQHDDLTENDICMLMLQWCMTMPIVRESNGISPFKMCPKRKSPWHSLKMKFESIGLLFSEENLMERWKQMIVRTKENLERFPDASAQLTNLSEIDWIIIQNFPNLLKNVKNKEFLHNSEKFADIVNTENYETKILEPIEAKVPIKNNEEKGSDGSETQNVVKKESIPHCVEILKKNIADSLKDDQTEKTCVLQPNEEIIRDKKHTGNAAQTESRIVGGEDGAKKVIEKVPLSSNPTTDKTVMIADEPELESPSIFDLPDHDIESSFYEFLVNSPINTDKKDSSSSGYRSPCFQFAEDEFIDISEFQVPSEDRHNINKAAKFMYYINQIERLTEPGVLTGHSNAPKPVPESNRSRFTSWPTPTAAAFMPPPYPPRPSVQPEILPITTPIYAGASGLYQYNMPSKRISVWPDNYTNGKRPRIHSDLIGLPPPYSRQPLDSCVGTGITPLPPSFLNRSENVNIHTGTNHCGSLSSNSILPQNYSFSEQVVQYKNASFHNEINNSSRSIIGERNISESASPINPTLVIDTCGAANNQYDFKLSLTGADSDVSENCNQLNRQLASNVNNIQTGSADNRLSSGRLYDMLNIPTTVTQIERNNADLHKGNPKYVSATKVQESGATLPICVSSSSRGNRNVIPTSILQSNKNVFPHSAAEKNLNTEQVSNRTLLDICEKLPVTNGKPKKSSNGVMGTVNSATILQNDFRKDGVNKSFALRGGCASSIWRPQNALMTRNNLVHSIQGGGNASVDPITDNNTPECVPEYSITVTDNLQEKSHLTQEINLNGGNKTNPRYVLVIKNMTNIRTENNILESSVLHCNSQTTVFDKNVTQPSNVVSKYNHSRSSFIKENINKPKGSGVTGENSRNGTKQVNVLSKSTSEHSVGTEHHTRHSTNINQVKSGNILNQSDQWNSRNADIFKKSFKINPTFSLPVSVKPLNGTDECSLQNLNDGVISMHTSTPHAGLARENANSIASANSENENILQHTKSGSGEIFGLLKKMVHSIDSCAVNKNEVDLKEKPGRRISSYSVSENDANSSKETTQKAKTNDKQKNFSCVDLFGGNVVSDAKLGSVKSIRRNSIAIKDPVQRNTNILHNTKTKLSVTPKRLIDVECASEYPNRANVDPESSKPKKQNAITDNRLATKSQNCTVVKKYSEDNRSNSEYKNTSVKKYSEANNGTEKQPDKSITESPKINDAVKKYSDRTYISLKYVNSDGKNVYQIVNAKKPKEKLEADVDNENHSQKRKHKRNHADRRSTRSDTVHPYKIQKLPQPEDKARPINLRLQSSPGPVTEKFSGTFDFSRPSGDKVSKDANCQNRPKSLVLSDLLTDAAGDNVV